jgi:hypothetical protein
MLYFDYLLQFPKNPQIYVLGEKSPKLGTLFWPFYFEFYLSLCESGLMII